MEPERECALMDSKFRAQHIGKALLLGKPVSTADRVWTAKLILAATNYTAAINTLCSGEGDYDPGTLLTSGGLL